MDKQMRKFVENLNGKGWYTRWDGEQNKLGVMKVQGEDTYIFELFKNDGEINCYAHHKDGYGFISAIEPNSNRFDDIVTYLELIYQNWHGYEINFKTNVVTYDGK